MTIAVQFFSPFYLNAYSQLCFSGHAQGIILYPLMRVRNNLLSGSHFLSNLFCWGSKLSVRNSRVSVRQELHVLTKH